MGHGRFPAHLYRIGVSETALCDCGNFLAALEHLFFSCLKHRDKSASLLSELTALGVPLPTCTATLLSTHNRDVFDALIGFMVAINLTI